MEIAAAKMRAALENAELTAHVEMERPEKLVDKSGYVTDADPGSEYLLGVGERIGIYEVSITTRKCTPLLPGVETSAAAFARAMASRSCMQLFLLVKSRFTVSFGAKVNSSESPRSR